MNINEDIILPIIQLQWQKYNNEIYQGTDVENGLKNIQEKTEKHIKKTWTNYLISILKFFN